MLSGLKHQLRAAEHSLCSAFICLAARHAFRNCTVRHRLDQYKNPGRRTAADAGQHIHQAFRKLNRLAETVQDSRRFFFHLRSYPAAIADSGTAFPDQCRRIGHRTHKRKRRTELLFQPRKAFACRNAQNRLAGQINVANLSDHFLQKLRLYGKNQKLCLPRGFQVIACHRDAKHFMYFAFSLRRFCRTVNFLRHSQVISQNSSNHRLRHISKSDKTDFHLCLSFLRTLFAHVEFVSSARRHKSRA